MVYFTAFRFVSSATQHAKLSIITYRYTYIIPECTSSQTEIGLLGRHLRSGGCKWPHMQKSRSLTCIRLSEMQHSLVYHSLHSISNRCSHNPVLGNNVPNRISQPPFSSPQIALSASIVSPMFYNYCYRRQLRPHTAIIWPDAMPQRIATHALLGNRRGRCIHQSRLRLKQSCFTLCSLSELDPDLRLLRTA